MDYSKSGLNRMMLPVNPKALGWTRLAQANLADCSDKNHFLFYNHLIKALLNLHVAIYYQDIRIEDIEDYGETAVKIIRALRDIK